MRVFALVVVVVALVACGERPIDHQADSGIFPVPVPPIGDDAGATAETDAGASDAGVELPDAGAPLTVTVLDTRTWDGGNQSWTYQLLKLQRGAGEPTYAQYFPPEDGGAAPVVLFTMPYDGIDWSGDPVDEKWAARAPGSYPDDDQPDWRPDAGMHSIAWNGVLAPDQFASDHALFKLHGVSALAVYGRFYAGGSVQNDIDDMVNGLVFLQDRQDVDHANIGIVGGSWGGFEAIYGAAYAPEGARPKAGVAFFPLSDFENQMVFLKYGLSRFSNPALRTAYENLFEPYTRRIRATTGGWPGELGADYSPLNYTAVISRLQTPFLIQHEDWDTLVPFEQSTTLANARPELIDHVWFEHAAPPLDWNQLAPSHGPLIAKYGYWTMVTFEHSYLLLRLTTGPVLVPYAQSQFRAYLVDVRQRQMEGRNQKHVVKRLHELTDPRVAIAYDVESNTFRTGAEWIASEVNAVWGTTYTAANIRAALAANLP